MELFMDALLDTLLDTAKLFPFLFLTYLLMEYLEHSTADKAVRWLKKSGKLGPIIGGVSGLLPQCGFSAAASNLYAGRVITLGTLLAVFLATSDEMLPIMISNKVAPGIVMKILAVKLFVGVIAGMLVDAVMHFCKKDDEHHHIHEMCEKEHCHCENGVVKSALLHSIKVVLFIFVLSLALNYFMVYIGEAGIEYVTIGESYAVIVLASFVGLIPNCAVSVALTQLYMGGMLSGGALLAGLLVGSGVGSLVLVRVNKPFFESVKIIALVWAIGLFVGFVTKFLGLTLI